MIGIIFLILLLSGCKERDKYVFLQPLEGVQSIEIVYVSPYQPYNHVDYLELQPIACINKSNWDIFTNEFEKMTCHSYFLDPPLGISGNAIKLTYTDGAVELICAKSVLHYIDGEEKYQNIYFDQAEFDNFISKIQDMCDKTGDGSVS